VAVATSQNRYAGGPSPSGLADVLDLILDKGLVIDLYLRVSLVGIELLTIDARIVVASVDTYLRFAEAVGRLNIDQDESKENLPDLMSDMTRGVSKGKAGGALDAAKEKVEDFFKDDDDDDGGERRPARKPRERTRRTAKRREAEE
jgi:hypothetical protein